MESEIEQADSVRERITLCIIDIDTALDGATKGATTPPPIVPDDHLEPVEGGEHERSEHPSVPNARRRQLVTPPDLTCLHLSLLRVHLQSWLPQV